MISDTAEPLSLALPKGRLMEDVGKFFKQKGLDFSFDNRKLVSYDKSGNLKIFLVKNSDLPTYVNHGIAGLGICGSDVLYESGYKFFNLMTFDFGGTSMCIAGMKGAKRTANERKLSVATKFTKFTSDYFHKQGIPVEIVKLNGSVELAPVLGLTPYIVDLVETGNTLKANNLEILEKLEDIKVHLVVNPAYYKLHYKSIKRIVSILKAKT
ncbi:MAG: ATP phosphoribosyltransferase [Spirochaetales bacterium]|nr:ATP phosphoribosyltransferase [Spirochaetales bacterium]